MSIQVAVGVICCRGLVLIAQRQKHQHLAELWEFPGGKIEAGESAEAALVRELDEELGLTISAQQCNPLMTITHQYESAKVILEVFYLELTDSAFNSAIGKEGQAVKQVAISELDNYQFPAANQEIIAALRKLSTT